MILKYNNATARELYSVQIERIKSWIVERRKRPKSTT